MIERYFITSNHGAALFNLGLKDEIALEEKNAQLEQSQQFIFSLLTAMSDVLVACNQAGVIEETNAALSELVGRPEPQLRGERFDKVAAWALPTAWVVHLLALVFDIAGWGSDVRGARLGFAPVLSLTVWIVVGLHAIESRFVPLPTVRGWLGPAGAVVVLLALLFPGDPRPLASPLAPLHFVLGVGAYGLFGAQGLNAFTSHDRTVYTVDIPANRLEAWAMSQARWRATSSGHTR